MAARVNFFLVLLPAFSSLTVIDKNSSYSWVMTESSLASVTEQESWKEVRALHIMTMNGNLRRLLASSAWRTVRSHSGTFLRWLTSAACTVARFQPASARWDSIVESIDWSGHVRTAPQPSSYWIPPGHVTLYLNLIGTWIWLVRNNSRAETWTINPFDQTLSRFFRRRVWLAILFLYIS